MRELRLIKENIGIPADFLTTVTVNTFRPEYYFNKKDVVTKAVAVHKNFVDRDPAGYRRAVEKALPLMLDAHKILAAVYLWDRELAVPEQIASILKQTRPDYIADFWITIREHGKVLGLKHKTLSASARHILHILADFTDSRQFALWLMKNRKQWNKAFYYSHVKLKDGDQEWLVAKFGFGHKTKLRTFKNGKLQDLMTDLANIESLRKEKKLTIEAFKNSCLPYRMLEGYASGQLDTTTKEWYWATFEKMTNYEVLRRVDAMRRSGFLDEYEDLFKNRIGQAARHIDPVAIASVILQHNELQDYLFDALWDSMESIELNFPENSVVVCDSSRSMKLKKTRPQPRVLWELVAYASKIYAEVPTYSFSDKPKIYTGEGVFLASEPDSAQGPTSISRALLTAAKEHKPDWIFLLSDMQQNIPYRGHEREVAKKIDAAIVTLNPTVNPLEPEAATRLETENEIFLPINGLKQFETILNVLQESGKSGKHKHK